jgi:hypothetical protein
MPDCWQDFNRVPATGPFPCLSRPADFAIDLDPQAVFLGVFLGILGDRGTASDSLFRKSDRMLESLRHIQDSLEPDPNVNLTVGRDQEAPACSVGRFCARLEEMGTEAHP